MAIEIERKFLTSGEGWRAAAERVVPMAQGYLNDQAAMDSGGQRASVRVRLEGDEARLNIKSRGRDPGDRSAGPGHTREEFDYPIPVEDARAMLALCVGGLIDKRRYYVQHCGHVWEIDEFLGENAGLVVAEVELAAGDEAFARPDWLGMEVTRSARYYNLALASRPYSQWSEAERGGIDLEHLEHTSC